MGFSGAPGVPKNAYPRPEIGDFRGHKNSWISTRKHVPFHWPISDRNRRGNTVFPTFNWHLAL